MDSASFAEIGLWQRDFGRDLIANQSRVSENQRDSRDFFDRTRILAPSGFLQLLLDSGYYKKRIRASASLLLQETSVLASRGPGYLFASHLRRLPFQVSKVQNIWSLEGAE